MAMGKYDFKNVYRHKGNISQQRGENIVVALTMHCRKNKEGRKVKGRR